ncbi:MAG: HNH endonuclease [Chloroflexi bacterium]|nr:HNH endonuclease [Chloroflexota bacterium]
MDSAVLVLNQNYEPLNICNARRAIVLVLKGKAEVLERNHRIVKTMTEEYHCPSVIRLVYLIKKPRPAAKLTRREIFVRDNYTCQYCGAKTKDLTLDHVIPKHRGGQHTWENLVSACKPCNHRKGGKTLQESGLKLSHQPREPKVNSYYVVYRYLDGSANEEWLKFIPDLSQSIN